MSDEQTSKKLVDCAITREAAVEPTLADEPCPSMTAAVRPRERDTGRIPLDLHFVILWAAAGLTLTLLANSLGFAPEIGPLVDLGE